MRQAEVYRAPVQEARAARNIKRKTGHIGGEKTVMNGKEQFRWIENNIDISEFYDRLPRLIKNIIAQAEQDDRDNMEMAYFNDCEAIECQSKMLTPDIISDQEWEMLCTKYSLPLEEGK